MAAARIPRIPPRGARRLLEGKEVDYTYAGKTRRDKVFSIATATSSISTTPSRYTSRPTGPKALRATGEYGDGWITVTGSPEDFPPARCNWSRPARKEPGRKIGPGLFTPVALTTACVLRPGEKAQRRTGRKRDRLAGGLARCISPMKSGKQRGEKDELIPPFFANIWDDYLKRVKKTTACPRPGAISGRSTKGHCTFLVARRRRRFITSRGDSRESASSARPEEIIHRGAPSWKKAGIKEVTMLPPADYQRKVFRDMGGDGRPGLSLARVFASRRFARTPNSSGSPNGFGNLEQQGVKPARTRSSTTAIRTLES